MNKGVPIPLQAPPRVAAPPRPIPRLYLILVAAAALFLTNPTLDQFAQHVSGWALADEPAPHSGAEALGVALAHNAMPGIVRDWFQRDNFLLFSVYRARRNGTPFFLGIGGQFLPLPRRMGTEITSEDQSRPGRIDRV